jgi:Ca2+-binding RTX toxin-like protein
LSKGSDLITLGAGTDTLYYAKSEDKKGGASTVADFTSGVDKILLDKGSNYQITGGGKTIIFKAAHSDGSTTLISCKDVFKVSDINFLG